MNLRLIASLSNCSGKPSQSRRFSAAESVCADTRVKIMKPAPKPAVAASAAKAPVAKAPAVGASKPTIAASAAKAPTAASKPAAGATKLSAKPSPTKLATSGAKAAPGVKAGAAPSSSAAAAAAAASAAAAAAANEAAAAAAANEAAAAAAAAETARLAALRNGAVTVRYNHYVKSFTIVDGKLSAEAIDDELALTFVFKSCKIHICPAVDDSKNPPAAPALLPESGDPVVFSGLEAGRTYWAIVEEDAAEKAASDARQTKFVAAQAKPKGDDEGIVREKVESCSCIEGNPCAQPYGCKDWSGRYALAKAHGWKG